MISKHISKEAAIQAFLIYSSWLLKGNCRLCHASKSSKYHILSPWLQHTAKEPWSPAGVAHWSQPVLVIIMNCFNMVKIHPISGSFSFILLVHAWIKRCIVSNLYIRFIFICLQNKTTSKWVFSPLGMHSSKNKVDSPDLPTGPFSLEPFPNTCATALERLFLFWRSGTNVHHPFLPPLMHLGAEWHRLQWDERKEGGKKRAVASD